MSFLTKVFGDSNERYLKKMEPIIQKINNLEQKFECFSDYQLKEKTDEFKGRLKEGQVFDDILPEALAILRESAKRTLNQRHFDVQLMGGIALHQGKIVQMATGEGKTLAATLPAYLNGLEGKGVHIVTVNDYLAKRDTVWMGQIYHALGLSVGCIVHENAYLYDPAYQLGEGAREIKNEKLKIKNNENERDKERDTLGAFKVVESYLRPVPRREAYLADITYGTNNEFGFDYLKDNMAYSLSGVVQRELKFAILDEIDFILIDESRTPLIISAPDTEAAQLYKDFARIVPVLKKDVDYEVDEKLKFVSLTEKGIERIEKTLNIENIYAQKGIDYLYHLEQALKAKALFQKDRDYIIKNGQVIIVDEFTGRLMPGRRWSGGLHQAVEAQEGVEVQPESRTLSTITFQNYFRLYKKLAGMTGTAITSAEEFDKVYKLQVVCIPTNKPMIRKNLPDRVYRTQIGKFEALIEEIKQRHQKGQPVLLGTRSIEKNEYLSKLLIREGIPHQVLNAKHHEKEAQIIAQAGRLKAVTVATNMAGRGVDIILGGYPPPAEIENNKENTLLYRKWEEEHERVTASGGLHVIGTERHEARRIDNQLRGRSGRQGDPGSSQFFLSLEDELLRVFGDERVEKLKALMERTKFPENQPIESGLLSKAIEKSQEKIEGLHFDARKNLLDYDDVMSRHRQVFYEKKLEILKAPPETLRKVLLGFWQNQGFSKEEFTRQEQELGGEAFLNFSRMLALRTFDFYWMRHLEDMEWLRESVRLKAFGQLNPLVQYKTEGFNIFQEMMSEIESSLVKALLNIKIVRQPPSELRLPEAGIQKQGNQRPSRNDPCPCGKINPKTGKPMKYKKCCWPKYG